MSTFHVPVMLEEVIEALKTIPRKRYIDATVGGGGHAWEIVKRGGVLIGIDADYEAIEFTRRKLEVGSGKLERIGSWKLVRGDFRDIEKIAREHGFDKVSGILFDLGVSSYQLDTPGRGFSYRFTDAPLDARFDPSGGETAAQLVNRASEDELYDILATLSEEQLARPIARAIFSTRAVKRITSVGELVRIVESVGGKREKLPAVLSRVFQALRMAVNDELGALKQGLVGSQNLLVPGGRLVVISFHSLEDRLVKRFMISGAWKVITKHPILPSRQEVRRNPRARSAKLRIAERPNL